MVNKETEDKFFKEFRSYLDSEYSHLSQSTRYTYFNDSKSMVNGDKGDDFWLAITDKDRLEEMKETNNVSWKFWTDVYSESATATNGINASLGLDRMFEFLSNDKDLRNKIIEETMINSKYTVENIINEYSLEDDPNHDFRVILAAQTHHDPQYFISYIEDYEYLIGAKDSIDYLNPDTLPYFLEKLPDSQIEVAFQQVQNYLKYSYEEHLRFFPYRYNRLNDLASERGVKTRFDSSDLNSYTHTAKINLEESYWLIHENEEDIDFDTKYLGIKEWTNDDEKKSSRLNNIPIGAKFVVVEEIKLSKDDEYQKFFDNGLKILGKGVLINNPKNGKSIEIEWNESFNNVIWYRDQFTADLALIRSDKSWARRNFVNFLNGKSKQDMDRYIKAYGKKTDKAEKIEMTIITEEVDNIETLENTYTESDFLEDVFITEEEYKRIGSLLSMKQNIILQGAPGVGKTYMAKRLAYSRIGQVNNEYVTQIQFHQSYSYEDLIMGYRPTDTGFELKTGPFYDFCNKAKESPEEEFYFIIDEINRGNISKIFGELLMLIESDKRGPKNAIKLMYSDEEFYVPENLYIIGLMNTADRSLAVMDYALRRRFAFYTLKPGFKNSNFSRMLKKTNNEKLRKLIIKIETINIDILADDSLGQGFEIGHSYFTFNREITDMHVSNIIEYEMIPLIEEYWYDNQTKVEAYTTLLREVVNE